MPNPMNKLKNIALIGFMGTGKSTIGRTLAKRIGWKFIDMDQQIEKEAGMTIPGIFQQYGEEHFRQMEKDLVKRLAGERNVIISTGGGTAKDPENVAALKKEGILVCLTADVEDILVRTGKRGTRPVLDARDHGDRRQAIRELLAERQSMYDQADYQISTSNISILDVCDKLISLARR